MIDSLQKKTHIPTVAVLGAGMMGCSVALFLAQRGIKVVLIDAAASAFTGASRWNEGKIHLGYLYGADQSLATAHSLLPGGLAFPRLVNELVGRDIRDAATSSDDIYLVHRQSITAAENAFALAERIAELGREHPDADNYFTPLSHARPRRLSMAELEERYQTDEVRAGYEVPERSVSTLRLADYFMDAVSNESQIEALWHHRVCHVSKKDGAHDAWHVETESTEGIKDSLGPFDAVVNALWEGRGVIDAPLGICHSPTWTHRYRVSLFARTRKPVSLRSAVVSVGPFGDVKNYDGRNLYLSWYNAGLLAEGSELSPPPQPQLNSAQTTEVSDNTFEQLSLIMPEVQDVRANLESLEVRGGWVYAAGTGPLQDRRSGLHRRDDVGIIQQGRYFSIDTGKYSIAPWLAQKVANAVCAVV